MLELEGGHWGKRETGRIRRVTKSTCTFSCSNHHFARFYSKVEGERRSSSSLVGSVGDGGGRRKKKGRRWSGRRRLRRKIFEVIKTRECAQGNCAKVNRLE